MDQPGLVLRVKQPWHATMFLIKYIGCCTAHTKLQTFFNQTLFPILHGRIASDMSRDKRHCPCEYCGKFRQNCRNELPSDATEAGSSDLSLRLSGLEDGAADLPG